jgi:hypothetical protein
VEGDGSSRFGNLEERYGVMVEILVHNEYVLYDDLFLSKLWREGLC